MKATRARMARSCGMGLVALAVPYSLVHAEDAATLPTVTVQGMRVSSEAFSATKSAAPIESLPRSVTAVTDEELKEHGAKTVMEALDYSAGVYGASYSNAALTREYPYVRGFLAYQFLDGLKLHDSNWGQEVYGLERVELLRGPASSLYGQGSPGGLIAMRSKRPSTTAARHVAVSLGNDALRQAQFDLTGPISERVQYRLVGMVRDSKGQIHDTHDDRRFLLASIAWEPTNATNFTLLTSYQSDPSLTLHQPLPRVGTILPGEGGRFIPRNLFLGEPDRHDSSKRSFRVGYELTHRFNDTWSFEQNFGYRKVDINVDEVRPLGLPVGATGWGRDLFAAEYDIKSLQMDSHMLGEFKTGNIAHRAMVGFDYATLPNGQSTGVNRASRYVLDLYSPVYGQPTPANPITARRDQRVRQAGLYLQDQLTFGRTTILAGVRHDTTALDQRNAKLDPATGQFIVEPFTMRHDGATTAQLGVTQAFAGGWSIYANYAGSFAPVVGSDASGAPFKPTRGRQIEGGVKWLSEDRKSSATVAVYRIDQRNVLTRDLAHPGYAVQGQTVRAQGVEVEGKTPLWQGADASLAYSWTDAKVMQTNTPGGVGKPVVGVPRHQASLWLTQRFGGSDAPVLSAGVRRVGSISGDALNTFDVPAATLFDLALRWRLGHSRWSGSGWDLSVVAKNVTNKRYVSNCDDTNNCYYGLGRRFVVTLGTSF